MGAAIGGTVGGFLGSLVGSGQTQALGGSLSSSTKSLLQGFSKNAAAGAKSTAGNAFNVLTGSGIPNTAAGTTFTITAAVVGTPVVLAVTTFITLSAIYSAFLPDASITQVAPSFSTDVVESRYIVTKKTPSIANSATPTTIHYTIQISKKPDVTEDLVIKSITDTPSAINKDNAIIDAPALPPELQAAFDSYKDKPIEDGNPIIIEFDMDASDSRFQNSLVRNDLKVSFDANGTAEEGNARAQTCFGDCPKVVVPKCWPALGHNGQGPYKSSSAIGSHIKYKEDAYDVTGPAGGDVYAAAPGIAYVDYDSGGYGYFVRIDHGGWFSYYAHMPQGGPKVKTGDQVEGGQLIGKVDSTGNSSGPHLHYEIRGASNKSDGSSHAMVDTFGDLPILTPITGPTCKEYYGK